MQGISTLQGASARVVAAARRYEPAFQTLERAAGTDAVVALQRAAREAIEDLDMRLVSNREPKHVLHALESQQMLGNRFSGRSASTRDSRTYIAGLDHWNITDGTVAELSGMPEPDTIFAAAQFRPRGGWNALGPDDAHLGAAPYGAVSVVFTRDAAQRATFLGADAIQARGFLHSTAPADRIADVVAENVLLRYGLVDKHSNQAQGRWVNEIVDLHIPDHSTIRRSGSPRDLLSLLENGDATAAIRRDLLQRHAVEPIIEAHLYNARVADIERIHVGAPATGYGRRSFAHATPVRRTLRQLFTQDRYDMARRAFVERMQAAGATRHIPVTSFR